MFTFHRTISDIFSHQAGNGRGIATSGDLFSNNKEAMHEVIYSSELPQDDIPILIAPAGNDLENFFADIATFHPDLLPLSALCHISESQLIDTMKHARTAASARNINAFIGSSIVEVVLRVAKAGTSQLPTFSACRRSLSFTLARADAIYPSLPLEHVYAKWRQANEVLGTEFNSEVSETVFRTSEIVLGRVGWPARPKGRDIVALKALSGFIADGGAEQKFIDALLAVYENLGDLTEFFSGPFDGRMTAFEGIVKNISDSLEKREIDGIAIGYFANRISSGSFSHFPVLLRHIGRHPTALIWYGIFAGMDMGRASANAVLAIGRKLKRDLAEPFSLNRSPQADVCVDELAVLLRLPNVIHVLKPSASKSLRVSLLPGVDIFTGLPDGQDAFAEEETGRYLKELNSQQLRIRDLMVNALRSLDGSIEFVESQKKNSSRRGRK